LNHLRRWLAALAMPSLLLVIPAQIAIADLDQDGTPEIVTTGDAGDESIAVATLDPASSELRPRLRIAVPEAVRALAVCPPEDHGEPTLVAVLSGDLWLVRAKAGGAR